MILYTKQGRSYRPATESEILSAYGGVMAARRGKALKKNRIA